MKNTFFNDLPPKGKLIVTILVVICASLILTYITGGLLLSIISALISASLLYLSKSIWLSEDGKTLIRKLSLTIVVGLSGSYFVWAPPASKHFLPVFKTHFPNSNIPPNAPPTAILIFAFAVILVINFLMRDKTIMRHHEKSIDKEFPEKDFRTKLEYYAKVLNMDLNNIDIETSWNDYYFTPVDAEVEIINNNIRKKKVSDLLNAIRSDKKSQVFLVLGDPGSGKSIALRQLAKGLLKEVKTTGKIPIYINLKEWKISGRWTKENPPTVQSLYNFVIGNLKNRGDIFAIEFINLYFKKMYEHGRIFFLLDSFDEIPDVLDADEKSWIIDELSNVFYTFLAGAHESRGILSSRIFRKPTKKFKTQTTFEIRPFTELKIEQTFNRSIQEVNKTFFLELFRNRPELVPIVRNPFLATLMIRYIKENRFNFPLSQAELYKNYISNRLKSCESKIIEANLTVEKILTYASNLSFYLFSSDQHGLEIRLNDVKSELIEDPKIAQAIIDILVYAKIGRLSPDKRFSFVHRRFNEYFVVLYLIKNPEVINFESIPSDSRWRDALVLYCEVADIDWARKIVKYCWSEMLYLSNSDSTYYNKQFLRAIHSLRFLSDSFRSRKEAYQPFLKELSTLVIDNIKSKKNILLKKYCVEAIGLLEMDKVEEAIQETFKSNNSWLYEIAFKSSRHLAKISSGIEKNISKYILSVGIIALLRKRKELIFSTSLSDAFSSIKRKVKTKIVDYELLMIGLLIIMITRFEMSVAFVSSYLLYFAMLSQSGKLKLERSNLLFSLRFTITIIDLSFIFADIINRAPLKFKNHAILPSNYASIIGWMLVFPFIDLFYLFKEKVIRLKLIIKVTYYLCGLSAITFIAFRVFKLIGPVPKSVGVYFFIFLLCIFCIGIAYLVYYLIKDFYRLKSIQDLLPKNSTIDRKLIAQHFEKFQYNFFRLKFIEALQNFSITPFGEWPSSDLPNNKDDKASILLAKLEAQWVGLE